VSPGGTENRSKREDIKGVLPEDDAHGGSVARVGAASFES
jgi:hypothetical protein